VRDLVEAKVHAVIDGEVAKLGSYFFSALPRIGEGLCIEAAPSDFWLRVMDIHHVPVARATAKSEAFTIINCELDA
jgi:hypothetical protein